jgi:type II secretion system protein N
MKFFKTRIAWAVYIICAALLFLYALFPSNLVKEYVAHLIRHAHPKLTLEIGRLKLGFPPGLKLYDVNVYHAGRAIADFENVKITPEILSLFRAEKHISFKGNGYGGNFKGDVDIIKNADNREIIIDADLTGIQVKQLEALSILTTHKISGNLDGTLTFTAKAPRQELMGDLIMTDGKIELSRPVLAQKVLSFDSIETELAFSGRSLTIERCSLQGDQLDGEVVGSIKFGPHSSNGILNLSGTVRPHGAFLAQLGNHAPKLLANKNVQTQGVPFKINGSLGSPTYSFY